MTLYSKLSPAYRDRIVDLDELTEGVPTFSMDNRIYVDVETTTANSDADVVELGFVILNKHMERITPFYQLVIEQNEQTDARMSEWSRNMFTHNGLLVEGHCSKCTYKQAFDFFMAAVDTFGGIFCGNAVMFDLKWLNITHLPNPICDINVFRRSFNCAPLPRPRKHRVIDCLTFCITEELYYLSHVQTTWVKQNPGRAKQLTDAILRHPIVNPNHSFGLALAQLHERRMLQIPREEMSPEMLELLEDEEREEENKEMSPDVLEDGEELPKDENKPEVPVSIVDQDGSRSKMWVPRVGYVPLMYFGPTMTADSDNRIEVIIHNVNIL